LHDGSQIAFIACRYPVGARLCARTVRLVLPGLLGLLAACGRADATGPDSDGPAPRFPVRQLESNDTRPSDGRIVMDDGFDELDAGALDDWWLLGISPDRQFTLVPARGAPGLSRQDGHVVLPPDRALVRHVSVSTTSRYTLTSLLWGSSAPAESPCPNLFLASMHNRKDQAFAAGKFDEPGAAIGLATLLAEIAPHPQAQWRLDAGAGFTEARAYADVSVAEGGSQGFLMILATWGSPLIIDNVSLASTPTLRHGYDPSTEVPAGDGQVSISGLKISGQYRISALVPPGKKLSIPLNVPEGAVDISLGTCPDPDPDLPAGTSTRWSIALQPGNHFVGRFSEHTPAKGVAPQFTDRLLPWPADVQGPVTVEFTVTGDAAMVFGQPKVRGPKRPDAPSLLFISIDTLRADHLGFHGYDRPTSPFLDTLAGQSVVFTDVTAAASYTLPAHASMFTGLFPPRHLAIDTLDRVDAQRTPTLGRILSEAGFHTAGYTGGGFVSVDYGFAAGFDRYTTIDPVVVPKILAPDAAGAYPDAHLIAQASGAGGLDDIIRWIDRQDQRKWMVFLHTFAVHEYNPPWEDEQLFARPLDVPADFDAQVCLNTSDALTNPPGEAERARLIDLYDATIHQVDRRLGRLIGELDAKGLLDRTIVVVTADHGEEFFDHGHFRHRGTLYQDLVHVPLLIRMPRGMAGLRVDEPVSQVDILPTLLDLLGQPVPPGLDGRSLADFVRGRRPGSPPTPLFSHIDRYLHGRTGLREGALKVVHSDTSDAREEPAAVEWELFDLQDDPRETRNLAAERPADLAGLRLRLGSLEASLRPGGVQRHSIELTDELREQLIELGYVEAAR